METWDTYEKVWANSRTVPTEYSDDKNEQSQESDHDGWDGWRRMIIVSLLDPAIRRWFAIDATRTVYINMDLSDVAELLASTQLFTFLRKLTRFRPLTGEDEITMVQGVKDDYRGIYWHNWPESLAAALQLDGKPQRVQLV
ncbi:hypothetical protein F4819DRAFT_142428 [Hypoxylon fuscum]|nr:hypothetical protein F4819DRAFT_142428 [Hypoxylon fuscum]